MHLKKKHGNIEEWDPDSGMEVLGFSILLSYDPGCGLSCHRQMRLFAQMASEVLHSSKDLKVSVIYFTYSFSSFRFHFILLETGSLVTQTSLKLSL